MKTSDETKNLIKSLIAVQGSLNPIKKDRENPFAGSKYATLDAILEELLPLLSKNNLAIAQSPIMENTEGQLRIGVETHLLHESGEYAFFEPFFMELEKGSKMNMAQSAGSIITYAKRYAISAIFGISTDEDKDGVQPKENKTNRKQSNLQKQFPPQSNYEQQQEEAKVQLNNKAEFVSDKVGMPIGELKQYAVDFVNKTKGSTYNNFEQLDKGLAMGVFKNLEMKYDAKQNEKKTQRQETEQGSMLESMTNKPTKEIEWGAK